MKELVVFDLDGTLGYGQSQKLFLGYLIGKKLIGRLFYMRLMMWFMLYKLELVRDPKKPMEYAFSFLKGRAEKEIASIVADFFETSLRQHIYNDAKGIMDKHRREDREIIILSNAIEPIVKKVAEHFGIVGYVCTRLEVVDGLYTGKVLDIVYGKNKTASLKRFAEDQGFDLERAWAYADHSSDQYILASVGHPTAVNPTPKLSRIARERNWPVLDLK
jgi:HAD superfamily hydrolase (TIGR01490 family)